METVGRAIRMGESSQGTQAQFRAAAGSAREEGGQSSQQKPRRFGAWRSVGPQRGKRPFEESAEGFGSCPSEIPDRTSGQEDRVVQEFLRNSSKADRPSGGSRKGYDRKGGVSAGNCSERTFGAVGSSSQVEASVGVFLQEKIHVLQKERDVLLASATAVLPRPAQCGWEMVHLHQTTFLLCQAPMSRTWNIG